MTPVEALTMYTSAAARVRNADGTGSIVPGMRADLVVLGSDPREVTPAGIDAIDVLRTVASGRDLYCRP